MILSPPPPNDRKSMPADAPYEKQLPKQEANRKERLSHRTSVAWKIKAGIWMIRLESAHGYY